MPSPVGGSKRIRTAALTRGPAKPEPGRSAFPQENDDIFWYHDGNVIFRAVPGQGTLFKLHRSRLSRQRGYFKNLFESHHADGSVA